MEKRSKTQRRKKMLITLQHVKMRQKLFRNMSKLLRIKKRHNMDYVLSSRTNISEI